MKKELPQEIQDALSTIGRNYYGSFAIKSTYKTGMEKGAQIASEYYEPKLAEKDAKIKELERDLKFTEGWQHVYNKEHLDRLSIQHETGKIIKEQAEQIELLKQQVDEYYKEADHWENQYIMTSAKLEAEKELTEKLKGLLKEFVEKQPLIVEDGIQRLTGKWEYFCKQHGIEP